MSKSTELSTKLSKELTLWSKIFLHKDIWLIFNQFLVKKRKEYEV